MFRSGGKAGGWVPCGVWNCRAVVPISAPGFRTTSEATEPLTVRQKADTLLARQTPVISCRLPNPSSQPPLPEILSAEEPRAGEDPGTQTRPPRASHTPATRVQEGPHLQAKAAFESVLSACGPRFRVTENYFESPSSWGCSSWTRFPQRQSGYSSRERRWPWVTAGTGGLPTNFPECQVKLGCEQRVIRDADTHMPATEPAKIPLFRLRHMLARKCFRWAQMRGFPTKRLVKWIFECSQHTPNCPGPKCSLHTDRLSAPHEVWAHLQKDPVSYL